ncbi:MAG: hypothetical protein H6712_32700 [Myxococcales bacterium]|nr:hypothetical protein [Myxococcales bacterium]MCB9718656.1 hypothetical protein [Myxococcales bacterium]
MTTLADPTIRVTPWGRTVRTVTSSLQALVGSHGDARDEGPRATPEPVVELPRFSGRSLALPIAPAPLARPAALALVRSPAGAAARELPWWVLIVVLPCIAVIAAAMTLTP